MRKLSSAIEQSIDGVAIADLEPKLTYVNDAFARMHGYSREEMIGMKVVNLHNEEQMDEYQRGMNQIKTQGSWEGEIGHIRKDGTPFTTYMSVTLLKGDDGKPRGIATVATDITEHKRTEEALRHSEQKFRNLVQTIPECVYSALPNGKILYMSPAVETIFGFTAEEFQKDKNLWTRLIHKDDQKELLIKLEKLLKEGVPYVHEFRMRRRDRNIVWIRDHANAALDEKGKPAHITGIIYDITERKRAEEALLNRLVLASAKLYVAS